MSEGSFRALVLRRVDEKNVAAIESVVTGDLPEGDVLVAIDYSNVNYKDGLAITGNGHRQVVGSFPFIPGVDFAGVVEESESESFKPGDAVVLTGWGVGETHWGGYAEKARVKSEWLSLLPPGMSARQAMSYGSAGLSAMLCIDALERYGIPSGSEVLVTGSSGGVGSVALMLLDALGYRAVASTQRAELEPYLRSLGAHRVVDARSLGTVPDRPMLDEEWVASIDNVGGSTLAHILAATSYGGAVVSLGLVGGRDLHTTVMPFIKRNIALLGVDSVYTPNDRRNEAWSRLQDVLPGGLPDSVIEEIGLADVPRYAELIMRGQLRGRTIVAI